MATALVLPYAIGLAVYSLVTALAVAAQGNGGAARAVGFSVNLIHRDSSLSPLYQASQTHWQRVSNALRRSRHFLRKKKQKQTRNKIDHNLAASSEADVFNNQGEYLMYLSIGTPPTRVIGIVDTGSDLIWTQCKPCQNCFSQRDPLYDPTSSSTYKVISCRSQTCKFVDGKCSSPGDSCKYTYTYGDMSVTNGDVSLETVTLMDSSSPAAHSIAFPNTMFGCGHHDNGLFGGVESGVVGLGPGPLSLISQMGPSVNGIFSYCLLNPLATANGANGASTKMSFGENARLSGPDVLSTPLLSNDVDASYSLVLEGVSVGDDKFVLTNPSSSNSSSQALNIIIDSGTTYTYLPTKLYEQMDSAMRKAIHGLEVTADPTKISSLCYKTETDIVDAPIVTFHFKGGADVKLKVLNTFLRVQHDVVCFTFVPSKDDPIYGNLAQIDFLIGYDLNKNLLYFKPTDCGK